MTKFKFVLQVITLTICVTLVGCTSSKESTSLVESDVLSYVPQGTIGFYVWDGNSAPFKKFQDSQWGQYETQSMVDSLERVSAMTPRSAESKAVINVLKSSGLFNADPKSGQVISQGVLWLALNDKAPEPVVGAYIVGTKQANLKDKLAAVGTALSTEGFKVEKRSFGNVDGLAITSPQPEPPADGSEPGPVAISTKIFCAATQDRLAVASAETGIPNLFSGDKSTAMAAIRDSAEFKKAGASVAAEGGQFGLAYLNLKSLLAAATKGQPTPPGMNDFPFEAVTIARVMNDTPSGIVSVTMTPKNDSQRKLMSALGSGGASDLIHGLPKGASFGVGLGSSLITTLRTLALENAGAAGGPGVKDIIGALDAIKSLGILVMNADGASPFPSIVLTAQLADGSKLKDMIQKQLGDAASAGGMPVSSWQKKDLAGTTVDYMVSPLGVGLYMAQSGNSLILASSEDGIGATLKGVTDTKSSLQGQIDDSLGRMKHGKSPVVLTYLDYAKLADLVKSAQSNLAMFTGGKGAFDITPFEKMAKLGNSVGSVSMNQEGIQAEWVMQATQ